MLYTLRFFPSKCSFFHNANCFGSCIIHILYTECAEIKKKNNSGSKRVKTFKIAPTCFDSKIIFRELHCSLLKSLHSRWRCSLGWALAFATIRLQVSRFLALSLHSFIPIFLRSWFLVGLQDLFLVLRHQLSPSSSLAATWCERSMCQLSIPWCWSVQVVFVSVGY